MQRRLTCRCLKHANGNMLSRLVDGLKKVVKASFGAKNLLLTNTLSSGGLLVLGDFIQQKAEGSAHDTGR